MNERLHGVLCHAVIVCMVEYHRLDGEKRDKRTLFRRAVRQDTGRGGHWC